MPHRPIPFHPVAAELYSAIADLGETPDEEFETTKKKPARIKPPLPLLGATTVSNGPFASAAAKEAPRPLFSSSQSHGAPARPAGLDRTPQAESVESEPSPQPATPPEAIVTHATPSPAEAMDDFAALLTRRYTPIPDGRYRIELLPHDIAPFRNDWKAGVDFVVGIILGEYAGHEIRLTLVTEGPGTTQARAAHDMAMLLAWKDGLGVNRAKDAEQLVRELGKAARAGGWRVWLTIAFEVRGASREARIFAVEVEHGDD